MKTTIVAVTCALCAACAASGQPSAQAPTGAAAQTDADPVAWRESNPVTFGSASTQPAAPAGTSTSAGATSMMGSAPATDAPSPAGRVNPAGPDHAAHAENTRIDASDRRGTLTPINQGNSPAEIGITATIRRGVMRDHSLSLSAKNVKIITVGTKVTLRGPVDSDGERSAIEALARQTAGVTDVDNQLEVKN